MMYHWGHRRYEGYLLTPHHLDGDVLCIWPEADSNCMYDFAEAQEST